MRRKLTAAAKVSALVMALVISCSLMGGCTSNAAQNTAVSEEAAAPAEEAPDEQEEETAAADEELLPREEEAPLAEAEEETDEAPDEAEDEAGAEADVSEDAGDLAGDLAGFGEALGGEPVALTFTSGAGGWGTELLLNPDGTFSGDYHDSDMGDARAEHGVCYVSTFNGRFDSIAQVDPYTWSLHLAEISYDEEIGNEWTDDGVLYIAEEGYGVAGGETFYFYLAGHPTEELPEEYCQWIRMPLAYSDLPETLPFNGLFNEKMETGFFSQPAE